MSIPCVLGSGTRALFLTYNTIEREWARGRKQNPTKSQNKSGRFIFCTRHTHTHRPGTWLVKATLISGEELQEHYEAAGFKGCRKRRDKPEKLIFLQHSRHKVKLPKKEKNNNYHFRTIASGPVPTVAFTGISSTQSRNNSVQCSEQHQKRHEASNSMLQQKWSLMLVVRVLMTPPMMGGKVE